MIGLLATYSSALTLLSCVLNIYSAELMDVMNFYTEPINKFEDLREEEDKSKIDSNTSGLNA